MYTTHSTQQVSQVHSQNGVHTRSAVQPVKMMAASPLPAHYMYAYGCSYTDTAKLQQQAELKKSIVSKVSNAVPVPVSQPKKVAGPVVAKSKIATAQVIQSKQPVQQAVPSKIDWTLDADLWLDETLASQYSKTEVNELLGEYDGLNYDEPSDKSLGDSFKPLLIHQDTYVELHRNTPAIRMQMYDKLNVTRPIANTRAKSMSEIDERSNVPRSKTVSIQLRKHAKYYNSVDAGHKFKDCIDEPEKQSVWLSRSSSEMHEQDGAFQFEL